MAGALRLIAQGWSIEMLRYCSVHGILLCLVNLIIIFILIYKECCMKIFVFTVNSIVL